MFVDLSTPLARDRFVAFHSWREIHTAMTRAGPGLAALEVRADLFLGALFRGIAPHVNHVEASIALDLKRAQSDLAWLPMKLEKEELSLPKRHHDPKDLSSQPLGVFPMGDFPMDDVPVPQNQTATGLPTGSAVTLRRMNTWSENQLAAFEDFVAVSGGQAEGATFAIVGKPQPSPRREHLNALSREFAPLHGPAPSGGHVAFAYVLECLLCCAVFGGQYSSGLGYARGRLAAWRTTAALLDMDASATFQEVLDAARAATWLSIATDTKWFDNVMYDGCYACLPQGTDRLTVVAYTDTD